MWPLSNASRKNVPGMFYRIEEIGDLASQFITLIRLSSRKVVYTLVGRIGEKMLLPEGSVIFSIKLPNMMQMQETLTGSTFDHLFSFFAILSPFSRAIPCLKVNYSKT